MPICLHADACTVQSMHIHWHLTLFCSALTGLDSVNQGEAIRHTLYLDVQVLSRPEVHNVYVEVIVPSLGQQFAQCEDFRGDIQHRLLAGAPYHHLCLAALPASVTTLCQPDHTEWAVLALECSAQRKLCDCCWTAHSNGHSRVCCDEACSKPPAVHQLLFGKVYVITM